ncbi:DUF3306 domain-containing protein [Pacificispira sp.]|uniref:DUF3306 domain-containing protein n=1 Tax=Pacificispira sp. TaxID=2888761 RepID=UPI003BA8F926
MTQDRFLSRWSRRKAQNRRPTLAAAPAVSELEPTPALAVEEDIPGKAAVVAPDFEVPEAADGASEDESELTEEALRRQAEELGLPDPETLGAGSDFKQFMAPDVPKQLRSLALRRLWRSNPVLANVDGLVDYGEDFTDAARVVANMQTAYQVGRGYRRDEPEEMPEEEEESVLAEGEASDEDPADVQTQADQEPGPDEAAEVGGEEIAEIENPVDDTDRRQDDTIGT